MSNTELIDYDYMDNNLQATPKCKVDVSAASSPVDWKANEGLCKLYEGFDASYTTYLQNLSVSDLVLPAYMDDLA